MPDYPDLPPGYTLNTGGAEPLALPPGYALDQTKPLPTLQSGPAIVGAGLAEGARQPLSAASIMLGRGLQAMAPEDSALRKWADDQIAAAEAKSTAAASEYKTQTGAQPGAEAGRLIGNTVATAPLGALFPGASGSGSMFPRVASAMSAGFAGGALQPVQTGLQPSDYWGEVAKNGLIGAGLGGPVPIMTGMLARVAQPQAISRAGPLLEQGVTPTIGQTLGGIPNSIEQKLTSVPLVGDLIKNARARAFDQYPTAAINQALTPIGEQLDPGVTGRDAIIQMQDKARTAYQKLLPGLTWQMDQPFARDLLQLTQMTQFLPKDGRQQFSNLLSNEVLNNLSGVGAMSGETFKNVEETLGREAKTYLAFGSGPADRKYGAAVLQLQALMRDALARTNPQQAAELAAANQTWSMMKPLEHASASLGAAEGNFSPAQHLSAIKNATREDLFAAGKGQLQPYAEAGKQILGSTVPDSGTAGRGLLPLLAYAGFEHPEYLKYMALGGAGTAGLYSPLGQSLANRAVTLRPAGAGTLADALRATTPYAAAASTPIYGALGINAALPPIFGVPGITPGSGQ